MRCRADIGEVDSDGGQSIIHHALDKKNFALVPWLVEQRADINQCCDNGFTPLCTAVAQNHTPTVQLLIGLGASVNVQGKHGAGCGPGVVSPAPGNTALGIAVRKGNGAMVAMLLEANASVDAQAVVSSMASSCNGPSSKHSDVTISDLLTEHNGDIGYRNPDGSGALHVAACHKSLKSILTQNVIEGLTKLKSLNQALDMRDANGVTALMVAARHSSAGDVGALRLLVEAKADCTLSDHEGNTALHYTSEVQDVTGVLELLIEQGKADPYAINNAGRKPFLPSSLVGECPQQ